MAQAGWYRNPEGIPGQLRYWDGHRWTSETKSAHRSGRRRGLLAAVLGLIMLILAGLVGATILLFGGLTDPGADCPTPKNGAISAGSVHITLEGTWDIDQLAEDNYTCAYFARHPDTETGVDVLLGTTSARGMTAKEVAASVWKWNLNASYESPESITSQITSEESTNIGGESVLVMTGIITDRRLPEGSSDALRLMVVPQRSGSYSVLLTTHIMDDETSATESASVWGSLKIVA